MTKMRYSILFFLTELRENEMKFKRFAQRSRFRAPDFTHCLGPIYCHDFYSVKMDFITITILIGGLCVPI